MTDSTTLEEWTEARNIIQSFDDRLDGIRRLGFSLVTTLLTADSLLLPDWVVGSSALPIAAKFAVLMATLLLLAAVEIIDRNYRVFQAAATTRAQVLEVRANLELTSVISRRYAEAKVAWGVYVVYALMGISILVLGSILFYPSWYLVALMVVFAGWIVLTNLIQLDISDHNGVDWSLDSLRLEDQRSIHLTATNLRDRPTFWRWLRSVDATARVDGGQVVWRLERQGASVHEGPIFTMEAREAIEIPPGGNFTWEISRDAMPKTLGPGTYQLRCTRLLSDGKTALSRAPLPPRVFVSAK